jgi:monovalent cation:proton antiporter-2 (CPA2) family protein
MSVENVSAYKDLLIVLATAGLVMPVFLRLGLSSIIGFLLVGMLLGPHVLGQLTAAFPQLSFLTLSEPREVAGLAELGVVFLMFLIGLELSLERLKTMRRLVFGLGSIQIVVATALIAALARWYGLAPVPAFVTGMALSLSSTAIVIQNLAEKKRTGSQTGRISFSLLLMQDLAVIPMLLLVTALAAKDQSNITLGITTALVQAALSAIVIVIVGRQILAPMLRFVAGAKSPDLFLAIVLLIALGSGAIATAAGLSMSMGAFIAGLLLAETEYRRAVEAIIEPFKGLLLGLFFLLVGLDLDLSQLVQDPLPVLIGAIVLIVVKTLITFIAGIAFKLPRRSLLEASLLTGPGGEFAFVIFASAIAAGIFKPEEAAPILLLVTLTMIAIPLLGFLAAKFRNAMPQVDQSKLYETPHAATNASVIIAGLGRVGSVVADMLEEQKIPYLAVDLDSKLVAEARAKGTTAYYGDATNIDFLRACGIGTAQVLAITMDNPARADEILKLARAERPDLRIIVRARDERHAMRSYEAGATEAVPETIEASLQLGEAVLVESGVAMGLAIATVHERRDGYRKRLGQPNRREEWAKMRKRLKDRSG